MLTMGESFVLFLQIGNYFQLKSLKNSINQKKTKVNTFHIHKYYPVTKYEKIDLHKEAVLQKPVY